MLWARSRGRPRLGAAAVPGRGGQERVDNPWSVLGVPRYSSVDEVRKAFRKAMRYAHPDTGGDPEKFRQLQAARDQALSAANSDLASARGRATSRASYGEEQAVTEDPVEGPPPATYQDFLDRKQRLREFNEARRRAVRDAAAERAQRRFFEGQRDQRSSKYHRWRQLERAQRAIEEAPTPEAKEAWVREMEMENIIKRRRSTLDGAAVQKPTGKLVGHRTVRSSTGFVKVPIFEENDGARYYVSPLTLRRVSIPSG